MVKRVGALLSFTLGAVLAMPGCVAEKDTAEDIEAVAQGVMPGEDNCSGAESLSIRPAPGSPTILCEIPYGTVVHVFGLDGAWAKVFVRVDQPCAGIEGWALKDYLSRSFC